MIPAKIEDVFIQLTTDYLGVVTKIIAGKFAHQEFTIQNSIYDSCPFLEGVLEALPLQEPFLLESMFITSKSTEYNIDLELFKKQDAIVILIHNRTNVYKYVDQLNQNRNDLFFVKRELAEKNKELDRLRKIADKANEEKSRFLAMMSHEIRNPLNSILGYAEMISSEKLNTQLTQYIQNLSAAGKSLKVIVDDILDLSRIEAGKLKLVLEEISIKEIIANCKNDFIQLNSNKNVALIFSISENIPLSLLGDSVRIQQILSNLITNAIKFTAKGSVTITVKVISETPKEVKVIFEVTDTGKGMSEEQCSKIFEEYQQNELNDNRIHGGVGLGLAIVSRLVIAMKGRVSLKSKLNVGTSFFVELPLQKTDTHTQLSTREKLLQPKAVSLATKKILVADDDVLNQTIVSHILKKENAIITLVSDGLEALLKIKEEKFDVILLDINMPNMTGEGLISQEESLQIHNAETPLLALTANTTKKDIKRYLKLGFSGVISKPYTAISLLENIKTVL